MEERLHNLEELRGAQRFGRLSQSPWLLAAFALLPIGIGIAAYLATASFEEPRKNALKNLVMEGEVEETERGKQNGFFEFVHPEHGGFQFDNQDLYQASIVAHVLRQPSTKALLVEPEQSESSQRFSQFDIYEVAEVMPDGRRRMISSFEQNIEKKRAENQTGYYLAYCFGGFGGVLLLVAAIWMGMKWNRK